MIRLFQLMTSHPLLWLALCLSLVGCGQESATTNVNAQSPNIMAQKLGKVLVVNSYHFGFPFSDGEMEGVFTQLGARLVGEHEIDDSEAVVDLKLTYLDSKRHPSGPILNHNVEKTWALINEWQPDIIIACDDNAVRLILDQLPEDSPIKGVFCGVNYSSQAYDLPPAQITGMIEVILPNLFDQEFQHFGAGQRIGFLAADSLSNRKNQDTIRDHFGERLVKTYYYTSLDDLEKGLQELQTHCDSIILSSLPPVINSTYSEDWYRGLDIIERNVQVPIGAINASDADFALFTFSKSPYEQGQWASETALRILQGEPVENIPQTKNRQVRALVNTTMAEQLGLRFATRLLQHAEVVGGNRKRVLYINSYHAGYHWGDSIQSSTQQALTSMSKKYHFKPEMRVVYMDTKRQKDAAHIAQVVQSTTSLIEHWKPDLIITADCNAIQEFAPIQIETPLVYGGLNDPDLIRDFSRTNMTGIIESSAGKQLANFAQEHFKAKKIAFLGPDTISSQGMVNQFTRFDQITFHEGALVKTQDEWISQWRKLQENNDAIFIFGHAGINDWDGDRVKNIILNEAKVPTLCTITSMLPYSTIGKVKIPEEIGWWVGEKSVAILNGADPKTISSETSKSWHTYVNPSHLKRLSLHIPTSVLAEARIIID